MAFPDDDHVPTPIRDADGNVLAVAHMSPDVSPETLKAMREVVKAAKRRHASLPTEYREEMGRRQEASRRRIRERVRRMREQEGHGHGP